MPDHQATLTDEQAQAANQCAPLLAPGNVHQQRTFVRLTLFEDSLSTLFEHDEDQPAGIITYPTYWLGLPLTLNADSKNLLVLNERTVLRESDNDTPQINADYTILPGADNRTNKNRTVTVKRTQLKNFNSIQKLLGKPFGEKQASKLQKKGRIDYPSNDGAQVTVFLDPHEIEAPLFLPFEAGSTSLAYNAVAATAWQNITTFVDALEFFGNAGALVEAFLADVRSAEYYVPGLQPHPFVQSMSDERFSTWFGSVRTHTRFEDHIAKYQNGSNWPSNRIGLATVYEQNLTLQSYQRGRLIETITLAPEETLNVEIKTWDKTVETRERGYQQEIEKSVETEVSSTLTSEFANETDNDLSVGASGSLGGSLPVEQLKASLGGQIGGDVTSQILTSINDTVEQINETTLRASEKIRQKYQVRISTTNDKGEETISTRTLTNPNQGRSLHIHHFEILANYEACTRVQEKQQLVLEVKNPSLATPFSVDWIMGHHDFLASILKHPIYKEDLDKVLRVAAEDWFNENRRNEPPEVILNGPQNQKEGGNQKTGILATADRIYDALQTFTNYSGHSDLRSNVATIVKSIISGDVSTSRMEDAEDFVSRAFWWHQFLMAYPQMKERAKSFVDYYENLRESESLTRQETNAVVSQIGSLVEILDDDWLVKVKLLGSGVFMAGIATIVAGIGGGLLAGGALAVATANPSTAPIASLAIISAPPVIGGAGVVAQGICMPYFAKLIVSPNDLGLPQSLASARKDFPFYKSMQDSLVRNNMATPDVTVEPVPPISIVPAPPQLFTDEESALARASLARLISHLEKNRTFYTNEFYKREEPAERLDRLRQYNVAQYVENRILGFAGTSAIYPLKLGQLPENSQDELRRLMVLEASDDQTVCAEKKQEVLIPTAGVTTMTEVDECDALEPYLVERRKLDLEERRLNLDILRKQISGDEQ